MTTAADLAAVVMAMGPDGDLVAQRLERGCRCFARFEGQEVYGYGWVSTGAEWIGEVGLEITPGPNEAYLWNFVTLPPYRLRGVFGGLVAHVCAVMSGEGLRRLWIAGIAGTAENALPPLGFEPVLAITGLVASAAGPRAADGFEVLGLRPGTVIRPGPTRRH